MSTSTPATMTTSGALPCLNGSAASLPPSPDNSSTVSFQPCAPLQLPFIASTTTTTHSSIIISSDQLLYLYSRFDLLLLILNVTLILLPLCKYLFLNLASRLSFMKCINKQIATWKSVSNGSSTAAGGGSNGGGGSSSNVAFTIHRHRKLNLIAPSSQKSISKGKSVYKSVTLNDNLSILETDPLTNSSNNNNNNNTSLPAAAGNGSKPRRSIVAPRRSSCKPPSPSTFGIHNRLGELITQTSYILLFLLYLGYTLELTIIYFTRRKVMVVGNELERQHQQHHYRIVSTELWTATLTLLIHLLDYGIIYGRRLWLSSSVDPEKVSKKFSSPQVYYRYSYTLHSFAFVYNAVHSVVSTAKLVITILLLQNSAGSAALLFHLLKPYLLIGMIILQFYFTAKHFMRLIDINLCELQKASKENIKYRRSQSTFLSMITFTWFLDILRIGYTRNLGLGDLGTLPGVELASSQYERFYKHYRFVDITKHRRLFLWIVCWRTYKKSLIFGALIKILSDLSSLIGPISIGYILTYISNAQNYPSSSSLSANVSSSSSRAEAGSNDAAILVFSEGHQMEFINAAAFFQNAYVMTIIVLISTFIQSTFSNNFNHLVISEGIHLKTALNCCIYNKALRMPITNSGIDIGIISNYMSTDSSNIFQFFTMMHYLWSVPIKIFILLYLLYQQMGVSAILGASIFFILSPFQYYCSRKISHIQKQQMDVSDSRLSKTTELFMGIKLLKLLGWDLSFADCIKKLRGKELELLKKDAIYVAINTFLTQGSAILVTMITFSLFPLIEQRPLTAATVFTSIALFNQITTPLYIVPLVIPMLVSAIVSHRRLVDYLSIAELNTDFIQWEDGPIRQQDIAPNSAPIMAPHHHKVLDRSQSVLASSLSTVALRSPPSVGSALPVHLCCYTKNGRFAWYDEKDEENATLSEVSIQLPRSKLTIVVGSIGCGKSTFLASLLGETSLTGGELHWLAENARGFGYVPSEPWIRNVSLRENIVFGRVFDPEWYSKVVQATCLQADIDLLPYRDQTVIGERGVNLSGGQRQRIALARAIYSSASTLILDDSLSALDPIVGYSVFDNAIVKLVVKMQKRTVILATHRQEFLSHADYVVAIESGSIRNQGTLAQIEKEDKSFFYQWNVIRDKERRERLSLKASTCKTMEERHKLVRMTTMKNEFRGPRRAVKRDPSLSRFKKRKPLKSLSRQMSCDASNALPCHDWSLGDTDDIIQESELEHSVAEAGVVGGRHSSNLSRLISSESEHSKHSYLSLTSSNSALGYHLSQGDLANQGSITSTQSTQLQHCYTVPSGSTTGGGRPPFLRLHSRISNYSVAPNSIIEEEDDEGAMMGGDDNSASSSLLCCKHNVSREDCGCLSLKQAASVSMVSGGGGGGGGGGCTVTTPTEETAVVVVATNESAATAAGNNSDSEHESTESEYSPVEDNTTEECRKLVDEVNNFNENQVETGTLYNVDVNPQNNQIKVAVYLAYIRAHSYSLAGLVFGLIILNQTVKVVSDFWLAKWTDSDEKHSYAALLSSFNGTVLEDLQESNTMHYYIYTYTVLSLISVLISLTTNVSAQLIAIRAVRLLHDNLIDTLVRCRLQFFDKTPIGRIMNRFTNDINVIDKKLPIAIPVLLRFFFLCLSAIIVNIIITPYFLFAIIPILVVYYYLQKVFRCTSRQLQRLELSTKAPIISHFNQTIDGLTTIRAFKEQSTFTEQFFRLLDTNNLCFLMVNSANCCLGIFLDYLGGIILFIATLISITAALYWNVQSAFVGLAMTYTLLVPVYLNWLVRNLAAVEMNMNSVERIYRYTQMDIEDSCLNKLKESDSCVPEEWPKSGDIQFIDVSIRYETNFEPIIKNASIHIRSGEKIGICGRTGSGKSSLISALFRINQICKGSILVDGQDIAAVCPYKLRKKLSIIPQDMVLFSGTVRQNLDPGRRHTDEEIWNILKDFQLEKVITSLDEEICDESQALSSGSRQLLCCVRAFLRHSPVLIMDESTSLLDATSEQLVLQQIFRSQKTIIAIAHRIINIANFDRVIVVDAGRIAEFDTPAALLKNAHSIFYSLYNKASSR